ncbi:MAG TPA: beta-N-acetylhexosaminidase [Phycisphaerae bacterium]
MPSSLWESLRSGQPIDPSTSVCAAKPDFAHRGLLLDVSRGKVPTLDTLRHLADRMAELKLNQLQLYIEHAFDFQFDPDIARGCDPLTADEIRALDAYCRERHIELVPCLAVFGHMGRILSLPQYRHLAEIEATKSWEQMNWFERGRGFTLDARNPESRGLVERMLAEFLPLFSAPYINICCDETYDLGKGKNAAVAAQIGVGRLYLEHLHFLHDLCARYGKRIMFWGDIMRKYPELIADIPRDAIVLNWGYEADFDFDSTALFTSAGLETYVCPSTWSFARLLSALDVAEGNIRGHAVAGKRHGAAGLLNTHWGDHGHINTLADAWHAIALGADAAWHATPPESSEQFDRAFSTHFFNDPEARLLRPLRRLARAAGTCATWRVLYKDFADESGPDALPAPEVAAAIGAAAREALLVLDDYERAQRGDPQDLAELRLVCRLAALLPQKVGLSRYAHDWATSTLDQARFANAFASDVEALVPEFVSSWLTRNKTSSSADVVAVLRKLAGAARDLPLRDDRR